jgi:microcystin-dependent protein
MNQSISLINQNAELYINNLNVIPVGSIICFAGSTAPSGWLLCNGNDVNINEYSALFSVIGTTYGSGSFGTFRLPSMGEKFPMGKSESNNLGNNGGSTSVTLTTNNLPTHTHTGTVNSAGEHNHSISDPGHTHLWLNGLENDDSGSGGSNQEYTRVSGNVSGVIQNSTTGITINTNGSHNHSFTTNSTGSGNSFDITNPYIVLNYIIRC